MVTVKVYVPKRSHTVVIGRGGKTVTQLANSHNVKINIPRQHEDSSTISVTGDKKNIDAALKDIEGLLGFKVSLTPLDKAYCHIPKSKYGSILGRQRSVLNELEKNNGCAIYVPFKDDPSEIVEIEGVKSRVENAIHEMEGLINASFQVDWGKVEEAKESVSNQLIDFSKAGVINEVLFFPDYNLADGWNFDIFLQYLRSAKVSMDICVFTMTDDRVASVLLDNHKRGVRIRIITDNDTAKEKGSDIQRLQSSGIACKMDKSEFHMHNKFCVIDSAVVLNGSYNWTVSASTNNRENIMITNNEKFVHSFQEEFQKMWSDTNEFEDFFLSQ